MREWDEIQTRGAPTPGSRTAKVWEGYMEEAAYDMDVSTSLESEDLDPNLSSPMGLRTVSLTS